MLRRVICGADFYSGSVLLVVVVVVVVVAIIAKHRFWSMLTQSA